jgi:hypothetical protein
LEVLQQKLINNGESGYQLAVFRVEDFFGVGRDFCLLDFEP